MSLEDDLCTYKVMVNNKKSTTFQDVEKGHKLYSCVKCRGTAGSCPDYTNHRELLERYVNRHG